MNTHTPWICLVATLGACNAPADGKDPWTPANVGQADDLSTVDMGSIDFGERLVGVEIRKDLTHRYHFEAAAGAEIAVDMSGATPVDSYLSLVAPSGAQIAFDDDGGGDLDAHLTATLAERGSYQILATTYKNGGTGSYDLELSCLGDRCTATPEVVDWQAPADPLDASTCAGTPLDPSVLADWIPLPGATEIALGDVAFVGRQRTCYSSGDCTPWQEKTMSELLIFEYASCSGGACSMARWSPERGSMTLAYQDDEPAMQLDLFGPQPYYARTLSGSYADSAPAVTLEANHLAWKIWDDDGIQYHYTRNLRPTGRITGSCAALSGRSVEATEDDSGNGIEIEREYGIYLTPAH